MQEKTLNSIERELSEDLLSAWLHVSTSVNNSRIVSRLSYNESLVCNILFRNYRDGSAPMTATMLCRRTKMLKSQMNRILNQLEEKGMIARERSNEDRRVSYIRLNPGALADYEKQHEGIMDILGRIIHELGVEQSRYTVKILEKISEIADSLFYEGDKNDKDRS